MSIEPDHLAFLDGVAAVVDPVHRFELATGLKPRPFQAELLTSTAPRVIVMASRQLGKSTALACAAWSSFMDGGTCLIVAPTEKQAKEFLIRVGEFRNADPFCPPGIQFLKTEVSAPNWPGRILAMPATENIRGLTADLVIPDEAAQIGDDEMAALLPIRKKETGRLLVSSTPMWRKGFFYARWTEANDYHKIKGHFREQAPELVDHILAEAQDMGPNRWAREYNLIFAGASESVIGMDVLQRAISPSKKALTI